MEQVAATKKFSRTVDKAEESQNSQRDGSSSSSGGTSLFSKSEESNPREILKSSNEIVSQGDQNNHSSLSNSSTEPEICKISDSKPPSEVHGFENEKLHLQKLISERGKDDGDQFTAVGVVGAPGVGKTALCQSIFHSEIVKRQFVPRIWIPMAGQKKNENEVVQRIVERLGVFQEIICSFEKSHGLDGLCYILHQQLIGKRYLIVLDDLQLPVSERPLSENDDPCSRLGKEWHEFLTKILPKGYGGKVIVTGRNEEFIKKIVGRDKLHQLQPLSDQESCWLIYRDSVRNRAKDEKKFEEDLDVLKNQNSSLAKMIEDKKLHFRDSYMAILTELNLQSAKEIEKELTDLEGNKSSETIPEEEQRVKQIEDKKARQREQKMKAEEIKRKCGGLPLAAKLLGEIKAEQELNRKARLLLGEI